VTHLLDAAELETEPEDVLQACRGTGPPLWPFQPTPAKQAVSILRQVGKGLVCFDDMTLDELHDCFSPVDGRYGDETASAEVRFCITAECPMD